MIIKRTLSIMLVLVFFLTAVFHVFNHDRLDGRIVQKDSGLARAITALRALKMAAEFPDRFRKSFADTMETLMVLSGKTKVIQTKQTGHKSSSWGPEFVFSTRNFVFFQAVYGQLSESPPFLVSIHKKPSTPPPKFTQI